MFQDASVFRTDARSAIILADESRTAPIHAVRVPIPGKNYSGGENNSPSPTTENARQLFDTPPFDNRAESSALVLWGCDWLLHLLLLVAKERRHLWRRWITIRYSVGGSSCGGSGGVSGGVCGEGGSSCGGSLRYSGILDKSSI